MKKRVLSFVLALLLFVMVPAETVLAMPAVYSEDESMVTLLEEVAETEGVVDETATAIEEVVEEEVTEPTEAPVEEEVTEPTEAPVEEEVTEPTEAPVEEEVIEPTEAPVEEATAEPTEAPVEEEVIEPTEAPVEEATAVPEVTPETEATVEPTAEVTAEPTETPVEETTAEPTEMPSATPTVTPKAKTVKKDVVPAGRDLTKKAVGSNGVQYEDVEYLSLATVNGLSEEAAAYYYELCDEIATSREAGVELKDVILYSDKDGNVGFSMLIPVAELYTEEIQSQFFDGEAETEATVEEQIEENITVENEEIEESVSTEETVETESETEEASEENADATVEEATEEIAAVIEEDGNEVENEAEVKNEPIIAENMELAMTNQMKAEFIDSAEFEEFDTLHKNNNYFKNQLSGSEKKLYDAAKKAVVNNGKTSFTYTGSTCFTSSEPFLNAISALLNTYPNSFNWMDRGYGSTYVSGTYYYRTKKGTYTVTMPKSSHYSGTLDSQAKSKVSAIVADAKNYAKNYPQNQIWAMVNYFDNWLCEKNYYNYDGVNGSKSSSVYYYCHTSYGTLLKGYGVCESYALAMTALLDAAGIRNLYVTGTGNGGGHAWNYVQMPDGKWYLLDSTWNDVGSKSDKAYFLIGSIADAKQHKAQGRVYTKGKKFSFGTLNKANYNKNAESDYINALKLNKTKLSLEPGKTYQLKLVKPKKVLDSYYINKYAPVWASSNPAVATVSSSGKVKAIKPGATTISYTICGKKKECTLYVYKFTGLKFANNSKTSYSYTYASADTVFDSKDVVSTNITVTQKDAAHTAAQIQAAMGLKAPVVKTSNSKVATATATLSNNTITLKVEPKKVGSATITVTFAGKKATFKVTNKYQINSTWFDYSKIVNQTYSGKAYKPKVTKTAVAPKGVKFSVSYKNNTNAGTATVTIKGTGSYTGTITKNFTIAQQDISKTAQFKSCTKFKTYNGKAQKASTVVKVGKKTLKAGKDYDVQYYYNKAWTTTAPTNKNVYSVRVVGKNNYKGVLAAPNAFEIKQIAIGKVTVSCAKTVKWKKGTPVAAPVKVKIGKNVLTKNADYVVTYYKVVGTTKTKVADNALKDKAKYEAVITSKGSNINWGTKTQIVKTFTIK